MPSPTPSDIRTSQVSAPGVPRTVTLTKSFDEFQPVGGGVLTSLLIIPMDFLGDHSGAGPILIQSVVAEVSTAFDAPTLAGAVLDVGDGSTSGTRFLNRASVATAGWVGGDVATGQGAAFAAAEFVIVPDPTADTIEVLLELTGDDIDDLTQGAVTIFFQVANLT